MGLIFVLGVILLFFIACFLEYLFYSASKKEAAEDAFISRTHAPKRRTIASIIITLILVVLYIGVALAITLTEQECDLAFWIAFTLSSLFIISIPFTLSIICINDNEVIKQDGIIVHRVFKTRFIEYREMKRYQISINQLTVYDVNDKELFLVTDNRVGIRSIVKELENHGIING